jgi:hypothetical protein
MQLNLTLQVIILTPDWNIFKFKSLDLTLEWGRALVSPGVIDRTFDIAVPGATSDDYFFVLGSIFQTATNEDIMIAKLDKTPPDQYFLSKRKFVESAAIKGKPGLVLNNSEDKLFASWTQVIDNDNSKVYIVSIEFINLLTIDMLMIKHQTYEMDVTDMKMYNDNDIYLLANNRARTFLIQAKNTGSGLTLVNIFDVAWGSTTTEDDATTKLMYNNDAVFTLTNYPGTAMIYEFTDLG